MNVIELFWNEKEVQYRCIKYIVVSHNKVLKLQKGQLFSAGDKKKVQNWESNFELEF